MSKGSRVFCDISILDQHLKKKENRSFCLMTSVIYAVPTRSLLINQLIVRFLAPPNFKQTFNSSEWILDVRRKFQSHSWSIDLKEDWKTLFLGSTMLFLKCNDNTVNQHCSGLSTLFLMLLFQLQFHQKIWNIWFLKWAYQGSIQRGLCFCESIDSKNLQRKDVSASISFQRKDIAQITLFSGGVLQTWHWMIRSMGLPTFMKRISKIFSTSFHQSGTFQIHLNLGFYSFLLSVCFFQWYFKVIRQGGKDSMDSGRTGAKMEVSGILLCCSRRQWGGPLVGIRQLGLTHAYLYTPACTSPVAQVSSCKPTILFQSFNRDHGGILQRKSGYP